MRKERADMKVVTYNRNSGIESISSFMGSYVIFNRFEKEQLMTNVSVHEMSDVNGHYHIDTNLNPDGDMLFFDSGNIKRIYVDKEKHWPFDYCIKVVASCPSSTEYVAFRFVDDTDDHYDLTICSGSESEHTVRYNSKKPRIKFIDLKFF